MSDIPNIQLKKADKITMAIVGVVVLAVIAVPLLTWWATVMSLLAAIMADTVYFLVMAGLTVLGLTSLWSNRTAIRYAWANFSRNLRRAIARENPIGVMDTAIARFANKLANIDENVVAADAARKQQKDSIAAMRKRAGASQDLADAAQRLGKPDAEITRHAVAADRWNQSAADLEPYAEKLDLMHQRMLEARELCYNSLEDMKNQREVFKWKYDTMTAGNKAMKSFKRFFGANPDLEMLQLSIEQVDEQVALNEASIDQFMLDIKPSIEANNLKKEAEQAKALERMRPGGGRPTVKELPAADNTLPSLNLRQIKVGELVGK